ncbi:MAG: hypothetical protein IJY47_07780 [Clostridia bacterium]|nr:hypothetical protein [Clostridia bacterium]
MKKQDVLNKNNRQKLLNLIYSVGATAIFNMVIQFWIYPTFERQMGEEQYGVALAILSMIAITAGTCGYAVNCSRLLGVEKGRTNSGDYNLILLAMGAVCGILGVIYLYRLELATPLSVLFFVVLIFVTMLRYYSEVEFRIRTDFLRYLVYYLLISAGYILGLLVFRSTGYWMVTLIIGEALSVLYVVIRGSIYRAPFFRPTKEFRLILSSIGFILLSALIDNIVLHADRILLLAITGDGSAVTLYYVASLIGKIVAMFTLPINSLVISYLSRYQGALTRKMWLGIVVAALLFGGIALIGCMIVSPWLIGILYPDMLEAATPYFFPAILGQIFYFVSGVLMIILLRFKGEKKQFFFNGSYAAVFFTCVAIGTALRGLYGFVLSILLANGLRFLAAVLWGLLSKKAEEVPYTIHRK